MKHTQNNGGAVLIWIIAIALLAFTGFRSVHLVSSTLPADAQVLGFAALAALDLGVLGWLIFATRGARGSQRTIATLMICVDLVGITAATLGDTMLIGGGDAARSMVSTIALWIVPIVVVANVAATIATHLLDPDQALRDAKRALSDELDWQLATSLRENAGTTAAGAIPEAVKHQQREMVARFMSGLQTIEQVGNKTSNGKPHPADMATLNSEGSNVYAVGVPVPAERPKSNGRKR